VASWHYAHNLWPADSLEQEQYYAIWPHPTNLVITRPALLANSAHTQRVLRTRSFAATCWPTCPAKTTRFT
jgi:hypothetical protein